MTKATDKDRSIPQPTGKWGWPGSPIVHERALWAHTAQEMADEAGIDISRWTDIETGAEAATNEELAAIARALKMSTAKLVELIEANPVPQSEAEAWFDQRIEYSLFVRRLATDRERAES